MQFDPTYLGNITTLGVNLGGSLDLGELLRRVAPFCTNVANWSIDYYNMKAEHLDVLAQDSDAFSALRVLKLSAWEEDAARWLRTRVMYAWGSFNDRFHSLYDAARRIKFEDEF